MLAPPGELAPPSQGNPGSATDQNSFIRVETLNVIQNSLHGPWQLMTCSALVFRHFDMQQPQSQKLGVSSAEADVVIRNIVSMDMS